MRSLFFTLAPVTALAPPQQVDLSQNQLVAALRFLNTYEISYADENKRFGSNDELFSWLEMRGKMGQAPFSLSPADLKPYELRIAATPDGKHYQISMIRPSDMHDKSTWCKAAAFTDGRGVIFLGMSIGCEDMARTELIR